MPPRPCAHDSSSEKELLSAGQEISLLCVCLCLSLAPPLSHPAPISSSFSSSSLNSQSLNIFPTHTDAHSDCHGHRMPCCAIPLSYLFCADKSLPTQTQQWMTRVSSPSPDSESPDCGQTAPSNCPPCQHEQLILGVIIPAMTLIATAEVVIAAPPPLHLSFPLSCNPCQWL